MKGQWIRKAKNGLNVVFIHGINSSEECWRHKNGSYWPELLKDESELADIGIYLFSYRTGINTGSYSLSDIVDSLREYFVLDNLISSSGIIFVCHSMGGIVARRFLVNQQSVLIERDLNKIGLFLVASPSLGSEYANMLNLISNAMGHTQASALKFSQNNVWLNDLDKDFINLNTNKNLQIKGKELIEDLPLYGKGLIRRQIVEPFSGAKYFGNSFKVPDSDHITIATPANRDAVQHRLLVQFLKEFHEDKIPELLGKAGVDTSQVFLISPELETRNKTAANLPSANTSSWPFVETDSARLLVIQGYDEGKVFALDRLRMVVGRSSVADIQLSELRASRSHFSISWNPDSRIHFIEDWGHPNRIAINSKRVEPRARIELKAGDEISLGGTILRYEQL
ncbi:MAG: alpha/beta fold hydrolase [Pseudanabaena sp.]|jgi:pimeloyl-ACP methyl ester carboxylesterase